MQGSLSSLCVFSSNCSVNFFDSSLNFRLDCFVSALFLAAFVSFTKILFLADLMLANLYTSKYNMKFQM